MSEAKLIHLMKSTTFFQYFDTTHLEGQSKKYISNFYVIEKTKSVTYLRRLGEFEILWLLLHYLRTKELVQIIEMKLFDESLRRMQHQ